MAAPSIRPIPTPPNQTDNPDNFNSQADIFFAAFPNMRIDMNALGDYFATQTVAATDAAATATSAKNTAVTARDQSVAAKDQSVAARDQAQLYAAAAGSAAGVGSLVGKARYALTVKPDESGMELTRVGKQIGDVVWAYSNPGAEYLLLDGLRYNNADYPILASLVGAIPDYGQEWATISNPAGSSNIASICYAWNKLDLSVPGVLIAVGAAGLIMRSTDNGTTWTKITGTGSAAFAAVEADDFGTIIAVGASGTMYRSVDFGLTWSSVVSGFGTAAITAIACMSGYNWVATGASLTRLSNDDGLTWATKVNPLASPAAVAFPRISTQRSYNTASEIGSPPYGRKYFSSLTVGASGAVTRWDDASSAATTTYTSITIANIASTTMYALKTNQRTYTAMAVGASGAIVRMPNIGNSIELITSRGVTGASALMCIAIAFDECWIAAGASGLVQISYDDGLTWANLRTPVTAQLNGIIMTPNGTIVAVGASGTVIQSTPSYPYDPLTQFILPRIPTLGNKMRAYIKAKEPA